MYEKEANMIKYILHENKYDNSIINQFSKIKSKEEICNAKKKERKTLLYIDCVLVRPVDGCIATETCRHSQYRNSSIIYVLLCFRR